MDPLSFSTPVILAGGGTLDPGALARAEAALLAAGLTAPDAPAPIVAADGAADALDRLGREPVAVIGDLDSLSDPAAWAARGVAIHRVAEQDTTDFEKCLALTEAPLYLGVGFTGRRLDHALSVLNTMATRPASRVVLVSPYETVLHAPAGRVHRLAVGSGAAVSIFPLKPVRCGPSRGLVWPLDGLVLAPGGLGGGVIGTSNRSDAGEIELDFRDDGAILLLEPAALESAIACVLAARH
ncbi:MAG: thiamine pyrophosphokinase [Pseudomonadota bacterium]